MHPFYLEKLSQIRQEELRHQAEVDLRIRGAVRHKSRRAWALGLGRILVRLGHTVERFGQRGHSLSSSTS